MNFITVSGLNKMPYNNNSNKKKQDYSRRADKDNKGNDNKKLYERNKTYGMNRRTFHNDDENEAGSENTGFIIGRNAVTEALKAKKRIDTLYVSGEGGGSLGIICGMANEKGIVVKKVSDIKLSAMSGGASHQGVIASGACAEYTTVDDIIAVSAKKGKPAFIIICDEIEDPHNLGAIIRTAEAAGADGIIIPKRRSASLNMTVFKTSAGAASWLPVARVSNIVSAVETLKKSGIWIYGASVKGEEYTGVSMTGNIAVVIGSEGFGIGRLVEEKCDFLIKLPMNGQITSLNASVAAGIIMYETVRQRTAMQGKL